MNYANAVTFKTNDDVLEEKKFNVSKMYMYLDNLEADAIIEKDVLDCSVNNEKLVDEMAIFNKKN